MAQGKSRKSQLAKSMHTIDEHFRFLKTCPTDQIESICKIITAYEAQLHRHQGCS